MPGGEGEGGYRQVLGSLASQENTKQQVIHVHTCTHNHVHVHVHVYTPNGHVQMYMDCNDQFCVMYMYILVL